MSVVFAIALPVFGLIAAGALVGRFRLLGVDVTDALNRFVVWLALPAVLFQAMAHIHPADLANPGLLAAFGLSILIPAALSMAWSRRSGEDLSDSTMQALNATFSNVGYMGLPLCRMAFGDASLLPSVIILVITASPQFGAALALIELSRPGGGGGWRLVRRVGGALLRNPLLVSPVAGIGWALSGYALPLALDRFLILLGGAATPCALVATGLILTEAGERFRWDVVLRLTALKLLVQPAIAWVIVFRLMTLPPGWGETTVLMSALPTGAGAFILARLYGQQVATTSGTVLVSTVLSFGTLSLLLALLSP